MKKMTKALSLFLAVLMLALPLAGCNSTTSSAPDAAGSSESASLPESSVQEGASEQETEKADINIIGLKGPTALGMLQIMENNEAGEANNNYNFTLVGAPDEITSKLISGEVDIAAVPTNLASVLYNKTEGGVKLLALNTLGVLYMVTKNEEVASIADLKGKTIYATGEGSTPQYALEYILTQNGLDPETDVNIVYKSEHAEILPLMISGEATIALLPQPFVTQALAQDAEIEVALDMTEEWDKCVTDGSQLTMGCVVARTEFVEENKEAVDRFLEEYAASVEFVNGNVEEAAALSGKFDVIAEEVAAKAIPECNIVFWEGEQMKEAAEGFLTVLHNANPQSVGGALPDEGLYYEK